MRRKWPPRVGHFHVRALQLTSQAYLEGHKSSRSFKGAEQVALRALGRDEVKSMNKIYALPEDELRGEIYLRILLLMEKHPGTWETVGAAVGLLGGLLSIALGVLAWAVVRFIALGGGLDSFLNAAEIAFFVLPLPLLALGAHCLDLLQDAGRRTAVQTTGRGCRPRRRRDARSRGNGRPC